MEKFKKNFFDTQFQIMQKISANFFANQKRTNVSGNGRLQSSA